MDIENTPNEKNQKDSLNDNNLEEGEIKTEKKEVIKLPPLISCNIQTK